MIKLLLLLALSDVPPEFQLVTKENKAGFSYAAQNLTNRKLRCTLYIQRKSERFIVYPNSTSRFYKFPSKPIIHCRIA